MKRRMRIFSHKKKEKVEEYEMVAIPTNKNDEIRSRKSRNGVGTIVEMCGIRWPHVGRVRKTFHTRDEGPTGQLCGDMLVLARV